MSHLVLVPRLGTVLDVSAEPEYLRALRAHVEQAAVEWSPNLAALLAFSDLTDALGTLGEPLSLSVPAGLVPAMERIATAELELLAEQGEAGWEALVAEHRRTVLGLLRGLATDPTVTEVTDCIQMTLAAPVLRRALEGDDAGEESIAWLDALVAAAVAAPFRS